MIRNFLKVAWRNLVKSKGFSAINITGLAAGLACFILIALYVADELSYDRFHEKGDRIYRVNSYIRFGGNEINLAVTSDPMGATLKKDYPQVEEFARIYASSGAKLVKKGDQFLNEPDVAYADSTIFNVFTLPAVAGETRKALNDPNTVVISESAAKKYFGSAQQAIGQTVETNDNGSTLFKVTAVIRDIPRNSHFNFNFLFSMDNVDYRLGDYLSHNFHTYLLLREGTDPHAFEKNFKQVIEKYVMPQAKQMMQLSSLAEFEKAGNRIQYSLMPIRDIHLKSTMFPELGVNGNIQYVYIFSAIALFVLLIACVNFMNLSTARSANRAKEVGIRKVLGTDRRNLINQFLAESTLTSLIAMIVAIGIAALVLPLFNDIANKQLSLAFLLNWKVLLLLLLLPLVVGLLAGSYPAFFLSKFQPIVVLKGKLAKGAKGSSLRSALVVFQFFTSIVFIIGTIVVYRQLNFIQTTKIGFNKEQVLVVDDTYAMKNPEAFKNEVRSLSGVKGASFAGYLPVSNSSRSDNAFSTSPAFTQESSISMQHWQIDYDYIPLLGMEILKGRNFSQSFGSDSSGIIINETTARIMGGGNPIGKKLYYAGDNTGKNITEYTVIGVVRNFNFESLRKNVGSLCFTLGKSTGATAFKVNTADLTNLVAQVEQKWRVMAPGLPFRYRFLDDSFDAMYRDEQRVGKVVLVFSLIAIVIACLGLFGLATYMAEQRTKEIGIRKVLGASVGGVIQLLSKDFVRLVFISFVIAVPVAWYVMSKWLNDFAYRINIAWWIFALAGGFALFIALVTVSAQAIRAALANPIKSLRSE